MITTGKVGVWKQTEIAKKINADRWTTYDSSADPRTFEVFGVSTARGESGLNAGACNYSSAVQIPGTTWCKIDFGHVSAALRTDGSLWMWGNSSSGQIGQNDRNNYSSPVQIPGNTWCAISVGKEAATTSVMALRSDNTLWVWGDNTQGKLGTNDNTIAAYSSPVQIPGATWCKVSVATDQFYGLKTDQTLWSWGAADIYGDTGQNCLILYSSPVQLPGNWIDIASFDGGGIAIKSDNTLWAWGKNSQGQLGQSNIVHRSSPVQIPGTTWCKVSSADRSVAAIKTDNTLWVWGANFTGQLGVGNTSGRSSPVQLPGTNWCDVKIGTDKIIAARLDNTLWMAGINTNINNTTLERRSSPVQIPGTGWVDFTIGTTVNGFLRI